MSFQTAALTGRSTAGLTGATWIDRCLVSPPLPCVRYSCEPNPPYRHLIHPSLIPRVHLLSLSTERDKQPRLFAEAQCAILSQQSHTVIEYVMQWTIKSQRVI